MGDPRKPAGQAGQKPARTDVRFDFVDKLPAGVPPVELPPTSMFPFQNFGPAEATYYFPIPLDKCSPTGVFFPQGFPFPDKFNVILYFHGHKLGQFQTINQYWAGDLNGIRLRHDVNEAGKHVVLIAPTMGENPGSSLNPDMGVFAQAGGGDDFLAEVMRWIGKHVPQYVEKKVTPGAGNIVLAGHSGAGGILSQQARTMKSHVCEVWGFDSMYGEGTNKATKKGIDVPGNWVQTATEHYALEFDPLWGMFPIPVPKLRPTTRFFFYWATGSPGRNARDLQERVRKAGLGNVTVEANVHVGGKYHFDTLTANFKKRVAAASCF